MAARFHRVERIDGDPRRFFLGTARSSFGFWNQLATHSIKITKRGRFMVAGEGRDWRR